MNGEYARGTVVPGTQFLVKRVLGAGAIGVVYEVEDTFLGVQRALRTLLPELSARDEVARRAFDGARTMAKVRHENIVQPIMAGMTGGDPRLIYFVTEHLNGQTLRAMLSTRREWKRAIPAEAAIQIAADIASALECAHAADLVHRDVSPDTIFIAVDPTTGNAVAKLLDLEVAGVRRAEAGKLVGTPRYMSPEQARGEIPSPCSDLYSLFLVLYEAILGHGPFPEAHSATKLVEAHASAEPAPLITSFAHCPPLSPKLVELIARGLTKDHDTRARVLGGAADVALALRNLNQELAYRAGRV